MPRIRCHYVSCVYIDDGFCSASSVEIDPDEGCMTFTQAGDLLEEDSWDDDDQLLQEEWDEVDLEDDDLWLDDDDDF